MQPPPQTRSACGAQGLPPCTACLHAQPHTHVRTRSAHRCTYPAAAPIAPAAGWHNPQCCKESRPGTQPHTHLLLLRERAATPPLHLQPQCVRRCNTPSPNTHVFAATMAAPYCKLLRPGAHAQLLPCCCHADTKCSCWDSNMQSPQPARYVCMMPRGRQHGGPLF